ncbi:MAG: sensor histidine kinase [Terriglobales bacterium]
MAFRLNWRLKALLPVLAVLLNGLLLFILVIVSLSIAEGRTVLVIATVGAILICGVLIVTLGHVVSRPMIELQEKIERVRLGDLAVTVSFADRNDEIGDLGRDFNAMVEQLRDSRAEIQRLYRTQISRAEHLATLGELAAGLAHEIRNPLAGIAGVMDIVGRDLPDSSPARDVLKDVHGEVLRVNRIVSDLLETARPKPAEYRASDFNATVEHAVNFARRQAKEVIVEFCPDTQLGPVDHDSAKIHQLMLNLLLNSIQAIDGPGQVRVAVGHVNGSATVTVSDNGRGIAAEHVPNIFRPFYTTKGSGTGLGLSLVKRIVDDHGGEIAVRSQAGHGTRVEVSLPVRRP